jgi:thiamine biosynthesis lipoprotein
MRATHLIMGMPITIEIVGLRDPSLLAAAFGWFAAVDRQFSSYRDDSEVARINRGDCLPAEWSAEMREVAALCEMTRTESGGYFDARTPAGTIDPSGVVKGWAIRKATQLIAAAGAENYCVDAGGDIQSAGVNASGRPWRIGVRNPFNRSEIIKVVEPRGRGIATSGTYVRGQHIYVPGAPGRQIEDVVSLTIVGPDILEADRFATAAFAMGQDGIAFIEGVPGLEGYQVHRDRTAVATSGFAKFCPE